MKPWEFRNLSPSKQAELLAIYIVDKKVQNYYDSESAKKREKDMKAAERRQNMKGKSSRHGR